MRGGFSGSLSVVMSLVIAAQPHPTTPPPHIHPTDFGIISTRTQTLHLHKIFQASERIRGDITVERGRVDISDENMWPGERGLSMLFSHA